MVREPIFRAADLGDPYACLGVAYYYHQGKGVGPDIGSAVMWYERAASGGCPRAHWELAKLYLDGDDIPCDPERYLSHLRSASEMGNADAQYAIACECRSGKMIARDDSAALSWFRSAAVRGHVRAKFMVGYLLQSGAGAEASPDEAEMWFSSAAVSGDADTFLDIGLDYEYGLNSIERNLGEALHWYQYGADIGHEKCIMCLSRAVSGDPDTYERRLEVMQGTEVQKEADLMLSYMYRADDALASGDEEEAFRLYSSAADLGDAEAMFAVAMMYHQGMGVKRSDRKALDLLTRASAAGSCDAQFTLGRVYDSDRFPRDETLAVKYYAQAAANGFLAAFYYLGRYVDHPEVYVRRVRGRRRCLSKRF